MPSDIVPINESWKSVACGREEAGVAVGGELEEVDKLVSRFSAFNVLMLFSFRIRPICKHCRETMSLHLAVANAWGSFIVSNMGRQWFLTSIGLYSSMVAVGMDAYESACSVFNKLCPQLVPKPLWGSCVY